MLRDGGLLCSLGPLEVSRVDYKKIIVGGNMRLTRRMLRSRQELRINGLLVSNIRGRLVIAVGKVNGGVLITVSRDSAQGYGRHL